MDECLKRLTKFTDWKEWKCVGVKMEDIWCKVDTEKVLFTLMTRKFFKINWILLLCVHKREELEIFFLFYLQFQCNCNWKVNWSERKDWLKRKKEQTSLSKFFNSLTNRLIGLEFLDRLEKTNRLRIITRIKSNQNGYSSSCIKNWEF